VPLRFTWTSLLRRIIALVREGSEEDALSARPSGVRICLCLRRALSAAIHITDVMYSLKREAMQEKLYPKRFPIPCWRRSSIRWSADKAQLRVLAGPAHGVPHQSLQLLTMAGTGWQLMRTGRLRLRQDRIKAVRELQSELAGRE